MEIKTQLSLFMENKPGNLAKFLSILEDAELDIVGMSVLDAAEHAVIRLITSDHKKCVHLLGDHGIVVVECDVLQVNVSHQPGELKKVAQILSQESINIDYLYGSQSANNHKAALFLKVSDAKLALDSLKKHLG
ncbi:MAG: amino acid-binding protein [Spirochaetota bacterium]|nr:amino acid-binding protein [Spirochaetota bacterium]